jgi:uncharacterized protein YjbJ (UPF0337 family)
MPQALSPGSVADAGRVRVSSVETNRSEPHIAHKKGNSDMAAGDKIKNATQNAKGKVEEAAGKATGDRKLRTKGKRDQTKGSLKQAGEKVKDAVRKK